MEKVARVFRSFAEADAADAEEDMRLTPEQRVLMVLELRERYYGDATQQGIVRVYRITQLESR